MQLQIKTLLNEKFSVDCQLSDTVRTIKEKIAAKDLKDKYEADAIKLIFSGKILEDSKTLESYSINPDSFLVVVKQAPTKTPTTPTVSADTSGSQPNRSTNVAQPTQTQASALPQQQPTGEPSSGSSDPFLSPETREKALRELLEMGFERSLAERALRASFYHVERATEYLLSNNIPNLNEGQPPTQTSGSEQTRSSSESSAGGRRQGGADELAELNNNPQFQALRQVIQQNPDQLQTLMQTLQATQPELYQLVEQRPQEFLQLLNQVGEDDDDDEQGGAEGGGAPGQGPPGTVTIALSPQDQQAITRLEGMGFDRNRVIEAFISCDRNEELAANFLLSEFD